MNTNRFTNLVTAALGLAAFSTAGCAEKEKSAETTPSPAKVEASRTVPPAAAARWSDIKVCTYETRAEFFAGLTRLEARVDDQIRELTAKRATMDGKTNTQDWDFAMKEMENARTNLKSM